jgi:hypothetical protein
MITADTPCTECGTPLGYEMAQRGQTVHQPRCPKTTSSSDGRAVWVTPPPAPTPDDRTEAWEREFSDPASDWYQKTCTLDEAHAVFRKWLGDGYDQDAINAVLATAAVERLDGDPLWLLVISGSGNAKTETVQALAGIDATVVSTITSDGALLSGTSNREKAKDATGGLLRKIGDRGVLVIKDVTSILSASRDARAQVLAAFREIHDGQWSRNVGTDGGKTLEWSGRLAVVGAVTTAWDRAHDVIATMGDRFVLIRMDSNGKAGRISAGRQAISNTGSEMEMRAELAEAAGGVIAGMDPVGIELTEDESERLLYAADLVTRARTGVDFDYQGNVTDAHAAEMPTRFAKQLWQVVRGAVAIGIPRRDALRLAIRCARDSMPPLRLAIIDDVARHPESPPGDVRRRLNKPRVTVDRQMQALHMLEVLDCEEREMDTALDRARIRWFYSLAEDINPSTLDPEALPDLAGGWVMDPPITASLSRAGWVVPNLVRARSPKFQVTVRGRSRHQQAPCGRPAEPTTAPLACTPPSPSSSGTASIAGRSSSDL